jgi:hypothetical protein
MTTISLRCFGYNTFKNDNHRRDALNSACNQYGSDLVIARLNEVKNLNSCNKTKDIFQKDIDYLTVPVANVAIPIEVPIEVPAEIPNEVPIKDDIEKLLDALNEFTPILLSDCKTTLQVQAFKFRDTVVKPALKERLAKEAVMDRVDALQESVRKGEISLTDFLEEVNNLVHP